MCNNRSVKDKDAPASAGRREPEKRRSPEPPAETSSGIPVQPYYGEPPPGDFPFTRGITPEMYRSQFSDQLDVLPWLKAQEDAAIPLFDANDWIYQTWAYDRHDVGTTPGMNADVVKALRAIKAKTLILTGQKDLLNPEWEPAEASRYIRDVRLVTISPNTVTGHAAAGGGFPADVDFLNLEIGAFLDLVTARGARLR